MTVTINGTTGLAGVDGSAGTPAVQGGDTNTGIFFPAVDTVGVATGGSERMRIDTAGITKFRSTGSAYDSTPGDGVSDGLYLQVDSSGIAHIDSYAGSGSTNLAFGTNSGGGAVGERMRIDSSGRVLVGTTSTNLCAGNTEGIGLNTTSNGTLAIGTAQFSASGNAALNVNRKTDDGGLVTFSQDGTQEGTISVAGTTVSYNGGHLSRWAQTITAKDESLVKGTVLSNLDEMNVYTDAEGNPVQNEQLNKVKVSDVEGDANVAGVFVNWTHDDAHDVDEINMAMTGDMIIRIAQGTTVQRGDLLMSAGDGTAKPQGDDIVRSKTVAKVTSTHVTCTYADGSFCVPCVLMAC